MALWDLLNSYKKKKKCMQHDILVNYLLLKLKIKY